MGCVLCEVRKSTESLKHTLPISERQEDDTLAHTVELFSWDRLCKKPGRA